VKMGVSKITNTPVALKFMLLAEKKQAKRVYNEIKSMIRVKSPYVIELLSYDLKCKYPDRSGKTLDTILMVLEYCPGGELFDILYYTSKFDVVTARTYFTQLMKGLKACHDVGIVHRDIKPQNLLLDKNYQLKITDFGLSYMSHDLKNVRGVVLNSYVGTRGYIAPELLRGEKYTEACDIFSCGVVLFLLLTGYPPFKEAKEGDNWYKPLCQQNAKDFWKMHKRVKLDHDIRELIAGMLAFKAENRLTVKECLQHKWVLGRKVHTLSELKTFVIEKHRDARRQRRKDDGANLGNVTSVKIRKKKKETKVITKVINQGQKGYHVDKDLNKRKILKSSSDMLTSSLLIFYVSKSNLYPAYHAAVNIFNLALKGNKETSVKFENTWNLTTLLKVLNGEVVVALYIREIEKTGVVGFKFKRIQGDSVLFARIMNEAENCLLTHYGNYFFDSLSEIIAVMEENKCSEYNL